MEIDFLIKGIAIGFSIAAPVGPIGILCIRRSLNEGTLSGLLTGLGAATADALYGCIAGFGLTFLSAALVSQKIYINGIGGIYLCCLGIKILKSLPEKETRSVGGRGLLMSYLSALFLTITNPMTILSFAAVFAGLGLANSPRGHLSSMLLVFGVFVGSTAWWFMLTAFLKRAKQRIKVTRLRWINWGSGVVLIGFGIVSLFRVYSFLNSAL